MSELSTLLAALPVPDHRPGFWEELEARLATVDAGNAADTSVTQLRNVDAGDIALDELHHRRSRRWLIATAAAAAIMALITSIIGLSALNDDDAPTITDTTTTLQPAPTTSLTTTTSTTLSSVEDDVAPVPADSNLPELTVMGDRLSFGSAGESLFAFETAGPGPPLLRSVDGIVWEAVSEASMRTPEGVSPSWFSDPLTRGFHPVAFEATEPWVHVVETDDDRARARIWSSSNGDSWTLAEISFGTDPIPYNLAARPYSVESAASPTALVVSFSRSHTVEWRDFLPQSEWGPATDISRAVGEQYAATGIVTTPVPGPDGVTIQNPVTGPTFDMPSFVPWGDLPPEAKATYEWLAQNAESSGLGDFIEGGLFVIEADGSVTELDDGPLSVWSLKWTGSQFVSEDGGGGLWVSTDGRLWRQPSEQEVASRVASLSAYASVLPNGAAIAVSDVSPSGFPGLLMVYSSNNSESTAVDLDLPGWGQDGEWHAAAENNQNGRYTAVLLNPSGDLAVVQTTDGIDWTQRRLTTDASQDARIITDGDPRDPGIVNPPATIAILPDNTVLIYWDDGTLDVVEPAS